MTNTISRMTRVLGTFNKFGMSAIEFTFVPNADGVTLSVIYESNGDYIDATIVAISEGDSKGIELKKEKNVQIDKQRLADSKKILADAVKHVLG